MAKKTETKKPDPYTIIPIVPKDFEGAIAANREARLWIGKWRAVAKEAELIIKGYQPRLF